VRNPFAVRRTTTTRATSGSSGRGVPGPEVMAGMEYLDTPRVPAAQTPAPEVAVCGIDPQVPGLPQVPRVQLVVGDGRPSPDSVEELLATARPDDVRVSRLTVDVRGLRDVLESRGGWNLLASLVRDPADRVINAVFRAAIADAGTAVGPVLDNGDVDADVCIVGEGDTVAGRRRHELGRARLALTPFLAESERLTRRLAEALARPRDRHVRRCLEQGLADALSDAPLTVLLAQRAGAPYCAVPGAWATPPTATTPATPTATATRAAPGTPAPREASYDETPGRSVARVS
jgi:hypothetical protein